MPICHTWGGPFDHFLADSERGRIMCHEGDHDFSPVASQRSYTAGRHYGASGSMIYSLAANDGIQNVSDFAGKIIGVGHYMLPGSYHLGFEVSIWWINDECLCLLIFVLQMLMEHEMNIWLSPIQA